MSTESPKSLLVNPKSAADALEEYCLQNDLAIQEWQKINHTKGFYCTIIINNRTYIGPIKPTILEAKESAARTAMNLLHNSKPIIVLYNTTRFKSRQKL